MRRRYVFSGRVQGVGFRATARDAADAYRITGWVRNDPDKTVTLEAQGENGEIDRFIADLRARMARHIVGVQVTDATPVDGERGFTVSR
jgi:acylphosphatase